MSEPHSDRVLLRLLLLVIGGLAVGFLAGSLVPRRPHTRFD